MDKEIKNPFEQKENKEDKPTKEKTYVLKYFGTGHVRIPGVGEFLVGGGVKQLDGTVDLKGNELPITEEKMNSFKENKLFKVLEI